MALWNGREFDPPQRAVKYFGNSVGLDQSYGYSYSNRGIAYSSLKLHQLAIQDHDRAIELDSRDAGVYSNRGLVY